MGAVTASKAEGSSEMASGVQLLCPPFGNRNKMVSRSIKQQLWQQQLPFARNVL